MELHPPTVEARVAELGDSVEKGDVAEKGGKGSGQGRKVVCNAWTARAVAGVWGCEMTM
jgi:hypothetical protein